MKIKVTDVINWSFINEHGAFKSRKQMCRRLKQDELIIMQNSRTKREKKYVECTNLLQLVVAKCARSADCTISQFVMQRVTSEH